MEEKKQRIIEYAVLLDESFGELSDEMQEFLVNDVLNRTLVYTNRLQFIDSEDVEGVPEALETTLAIVVVGVHKTIVENTKDTARISSIKDGDQTVTYSNEMANYLSSTPDADIFMSVKGLLDKFRVPTIVENT